MGHMHDNLPEVVPNDHSYPEVYTQSPPIVGYGHAQSIHEQQQDAWSPRESTISTPYGAHSHSYAKTEDSRPQSSPLMETATVHDGQLRHNDGGDEPGNGKAAATGCASIVFILSAIIGFLAVAVVGLAAGTGVAVGKYNTEHHNFQDLQSSYSQLLGGNATKTSSAADGGPTNYSKITNGCSDNADSVTGTTYKPEFFGKPSFTMYCNKDAANPPFYSLFTPDFNGCMSACAAWNSYKQANRTCEGISFVPKWKDIVNAVKGKAPGDCYLKPGPQTLAKLQDANPGTEVHAALLVHD